MLANAQLAQYAGTGEFVGGLAAFLQRDGPDDREEGGRVHDLVAGAGEVGGLGEGLAGFWEGGLVSEMRGGGTYVSRLPARDCANPVAFGNLAGSLLGQDFIDGLRGDVVQSNQGRVLER